jgi:hypothetical protein
MGMTARAETLAVSQKPGPPAGAAEPAARFGNRAGGSIA